MDILGSIAGIIAGCLIYLGIIYLILMRMKKQALAEARESQRQFRGYISALKNRI